MADIPSPLTWGTIVGNFGALNADSSDAGLVPDLDPVGGQVTITPRVPLVKILDPAVPMIAVNKTISCTIVNGVLIGPDGSPGVRVVATDSPGIEPYPLQWDVRITITGATSQPPPMTINVPGGQTVNLAVVIPTAPSPPIVTVVSEQTKLDAIAARNAAQLAETNAETAETGAKAAQTAAETARSQAQTAKTDAESARTGAQTARTGAETARTQAQTAETNAKAAQTAAETASGQAQGYAQDASESVTEIGSLVENIELAVPDNGQRAVGKNELVINVRDFGALGNGVANDTNAVKAALAYVQSNPGRTLVFPDGTYRVTSLGTYNLSNTTIDLGSSTIDASLVGAGAFDLINVRGTVGNSVALTANLATATKNVSVSTTGLAAGDVVFIGSNTVFDPNRTGAKYGELNVIESITNATSLILKKETSGAYTTADAAFLRKITPVENFTLKGGKILSNTTANTMRGVSLEYCRNARIESLSIKGINRVQLQLTNCMESIVTGSRFSNASHASQAYGVSVQDATCDIIISNNVFSEVRHSVSTNNDISGIAGGLGFGIVRRILAEGNVVLDSSPNLTDGAGGDALDTHAGAEDIYYINNTVYSSSNYGINFEARSGVVRGNIIKNCIGSGIFINPRSNLESRIEVSDNTVENVTGGNGYGISITTSDAPMASCIVTDNAVRAVQGMSIRVIGTSTNPIRGTVVSNNVAHSLGIIGGTGLLLSDAPMASISGNSVRSGTVGINYTGSNTTISNNTVELIGTSGASGWAIRLGAGTKNAVLGNTLLYSASGITSTIGVSFAASGVVTYSGVWNNTTSGFTTAVSIQSGTGVVESGNI